MFLLRQVHRIGILLLGCMATTVMLAQNSTSSPTSRFGYGELNDNVPTTYRAMGGISSGMRNRRAINPSQPASYTACDSMSFMFDMAASVMWTEYKDAAGRRNRANGNLEYVTVQFPIWKQHIAFSAGVLPYSAIGYDFSQKGNAGTHDYKVTYRGEGGFTQLYGGLSFNIMDWVALGANFYYMFGDATNITSLEFNESALTGSMMYKNMNVNSFRFRYGLQLFHTFAERHTVVLGAVYENRQRMNGEYVQYELYTLDSIKTTSDGFQVPTYYGVGASYSLDNRLVVAFDYSKYEWSKSNYFGQKGQLVDRAKYSFGAEYRHDPYARNYAKRMYWRVGASVQDSYIRTSNRMDFSLSLGVGLPFRTSSSLINLAVEYNRRNSMAQMVENNLKLTIAMGVNENWFFKRKL